MSLYLEPYAHLKKQEIIAPVNKEFKFFGKFDRKKSCKIFFLNLNGEVSIIEPESMAVLNVDIKNRRKDGVSRRNSIFWKPGYYLQALNMKNAIRKFNDMKKAGKFNMIEEIHAGESN